MPRIVVSKNQPLCARSKNIFGLVGLVLLLVSPLWFLGAGNCYKKTREKLETWERTEATVVNHLQEQSHDGTLYSSIFRFTAADGQAYEVKANYSSSKRTHALGEKVNLLYPQAEPSEAVEDSFLSLYFLPLGLALFGVFDFAFGCLALHIYRRREPVGEDEPPLRQIC